MNDNLASGLKLAAAAASVSLVAWVVLRALLLRFDRNREYALMGIIVPIGFLAAYGLRGQLGVTFENMAQSRVTAESVMALIVTALAIPCLFYDVMRAHKTTVAELIALTCFVFLPAGGLMMGDVSGPELLLITILVDVICLVLGQAAYRAEKVPGLGAWATFGLIIGSVWVLVKVESNTVPILLALAGSSVILFATGFVPPRLSPGRIGIVPAFFLGMLWVAAMLTVRETIWAGTLLLLPMLLLAIPLPRPGPVTEGESVMVNLPEYLQNLGWAESRILWTFAAIQIVLTFGATMLAAPPRS